MILSGKEIKNQIDNSKIFIDPFKEKNINPNSYNLTLDNKLFIYEHKLLDSKKENKIKPIIIPESGYILSPGVLYLANTVEYTYTKYFVPMIEGRSSWGRLGVFIHITAGFGDVGFKGQWTLEISCIQPVKIYPYMEIAQIYYHTICGDYNVYYGKYNNQDNKNIGSKLYLEYEKENKDD